MPERRSGLALGATAYILWGAFPLYFPLLKPAGAPEILAVRIIFSALTMGIAVLASRRLGGLKRLAAQRRPRTLLALAAVILALNWVTYIWGVNNGRVIETSLGYFINPLVTVLMGVLILGERLRPVQWSAIVVGAGAVGVLAIEYGALPWVALVLACSFGTYGLLKKSANAGAVESLTLETLVLTPPALVFLAWLIARGSLTFATEGPAHAILLGTTGVVTAVPLLCFSAAATRLSMVALGLLQYAGPLIQFALGVLWFQEPMSSGRWAGFMLVWLALLIFTAEGIRHRRRQLRDAAEAAAC